MSLEELYEIYLLHPSIETDTRKLQKDDIFFALKGPNFNGNLFAQQAIEKGAALVIADEKTSFTHDRIVHTNDALKTLQELAHFHRKKFINPDGISKIPFIAITGSNGKTTTKELLHEVLSSTYKTYTTQGNLNNHIGVPLTILKIKPDAEMAVIEMGANHLYEIESYCEYTMPTHGLITNIGKAHLEGFGGEENIKKGKGELFFYLKENNGIAFVNTDDEAVYKLSNDINKKIYYGVNGKNLKGAVISSDPFLEVFVDDVPSLNIQTNLVGAYNFPNVLAAVCIAQFFEISNDTIKMAIEKYTPSNSRSQLIKKGTNTIVADAYNANPSSMKAAIENFSKIQCDKKILILGAMMELGDESLKEHSAIVSIIDTCTWDNVILVGKNFKEVKNKYINVDDVLQARDWLKNNQIEDSYLLVKGSRSMQMEKVLE